MSLFIHNSIVYKQFYGSEKEENLKDLRLSNHITDEQYEKLLIAPHNLTSISRIVEGRGMFLRRKKWYQ